jgi:hypothetical protein
MYLHGKCLDHSYSFTGKVPSIFDILKFLENFVEKEAGYLIPPDQCKFLFYISAISFL